MEMIKNEDIFREKMDKEVIRFAPIRLSEVISSGGRINAEFYDLESKKIRELIKKSPLSKKFLNSEEGFAKAYYFGRFKRVFVKDQEKGFPIFDPSQMLELDPKPRKHISSKSKVSLEDLKLKRNQILMTRSGTIGKVGLVTEVLEGKIFSDDLFRIDCYNYEDVGYLYAFLKSFIGQKLVTTNNYGSVITHIEPEHLESLQVPYPSSDTKKSISNKIIKSFKLRDEAVELSHQSMNLLSNYLELKPLNKVKINYLEDSIRSFSDKLSKIDLRLNASYNLPIIEEIIKILKKSSNLVSIGDESVSKEVILPGRFKRIYVDKDHGMPFLGGKDILNYDPDITKYLSKKKHQERMDDELELEENMVLITRSGTIGNVLLVPKFLEGWVASEHIIRIVPCESINPGYIYAFLNSEYGYELIKRFTYGSVVDEIDDRQVKAIPFPLIEESKMKKIGDLMLEANKKRTEAYNLEKGAIKEIESLILR